MVFKQTTFNQHTAKILNDAVYWLSSMENVIGETKCQHSSRSKNLQQITKETYERLLDLQSETDERLLDIEDKIEALKQETKDETILNTKMCELVDQLRADMENSLSKLRTEMVDPLRTDMENSLFRLRTEMKKDNEAMISSFIAAMDMDIEKKAWLAQVLDKRNLQGISQAEKLLKPPQLDSGVNYFVFEDKFRGAREDVAQRQTAFLRYFEGCKNVLDIGCGRGEFLQTMREHGIGARGVDLDEIMVDYCHAKGLEVQLDDAFEYMEKLDDASLDGIFIDQVVEHLEPSYLIRLLDLCFKKMKYGFYLIAETVNPLSFSSFANFYIDLTHIKPVHPETLRFLFESTGFREIKTVFSSPIPDSLRLQKLVTSEVANDTEKYQIEVYNRNIEMLNTLFTVRRIML
jgi:O-antigen chain-terminating methyltransferase